MNSTLPQLNQMTDILDIKGVGGVDLLWVWVLGFSLLASVLGFTIYHFWKYRKQRKPPVAPKTPLEIALGKLNDLVNSRMLENGQIRRFYFGLSDIFREFIEKEVKITAQEATLEELRPMIRDCRELKPEEKSDALWLLELADMAKFAQYAPPKDDIIRSVKTARIWMSRVAERLHAEWKDEAAAERATA